MPSRNLLGSVLVATDFSEGAQHALERALRLPLKPKAKVTILHVVPDDIPGKLRKEAIEEAERSVEKTAARANQIALKHGLTLQLVSDVVEGLPAEQLLKRAHTVEADVICMGRHGRRSLVQLLLGSTSAKVVKSGDVPVLIVKSTSVTVNEYRRVVAAIDLTKGSEKVLKTMKPFVEGAMDLSVVHASSVPYEDFVMLESGRAEELRQTAVKDAEKALRQMVTKSGIVRADARVVGGDARVVILAEAHALTAELIVVGTHGTRGLKRLVVGSVADWVLSNATCDVLVARV